MSTWLRKKASVLDCKSLAGETGKENSRKEEVGTVRILSLKGRTHQSLCWLFWEEFTLPVLFSLQWGQSGSCCCCFSKLTARKRFSCPFRIFTPLPPVAKKVAQVPSSLNLLSDVRLQAKMLNPPKAPDLPYTLLPGLACQELASPPEFPGSFSTAARLAHASAHVF